MLGDLCCLMAWAVWSLDIAFRLDLYLVFVPTKCKVRKIMLEKSKEVREVKGMFETDSTLFLQ